jgi:hypothetical protein
MSEVTNPPHGVKITPEDLKTTLNAMRREPFPFQSNHNLKNTEMYNENLIPEHNEIVSIHDIIVPKDTQIDTAKLQAARLRIKGSGEIVINHKNQLISGAESLILAIGTGQTEVRVIRLNRVSLKSNQKVRVCRI